MDTKRPGIQYKGTINGVTIKTDSMMANNVYYSPGNKEAMASNSEFRSIKSERYEGNNNNNVEWHLSSAGPLQLTKPKIEIGAGTVTLTKKLLLPPDTRYLGNSGSGYQSPDIFSSAENINYDEGPGPNCASYYLDNFDNPKKRKLPVGGGATNGSNSGGIVRPQEELCLVCGDRVSGYHYNALTCEGCKGFFRRSITKNAVYQCKYGNHCDIDMYMRRKCQECRLKKCLSVGMRPECVVPEYQCAVKRMKKKPTKEDAKYPTMAVMENGISSSLDGEEKSGLVITSNGGTQRIFSFMERTTELPMLNGATPMSPEQHDLIYSLVCYQEQYEQPPEQDLQRVFKDVADTTEEGDQKFRQITEMTILTVQLIVEFAKHLPGFDKLCREDQITLLKACSSEVMMLRMARKYDLRSDSIVFANNEPYTKDAYCMAGMGETIDDLLRFCRMMCKIKVDNAEYALLTAIVIFSTRPALCESWKVEKIQEIYIETLHVYVENRNRPATATIFARLLSVLTELRTLGNQNSEMCFALKLKSKVLPPFLSEIWDIVP